MEEFLAREESVELRTSQWPMSGAYLRGKEYRPLGSGKKLGDHLHQFLRFVHMNVVAGLLEDLELGIGQRFCDLMRPT